MMQRKNFEPVKILRCVVCGFQFSDFHHLHPVSMGGAKDGQVIALCPNHHRAAHIIYGWIDHDEMWDVIKQRAAKHFDVAFNEKMLDYLYEVYKPFSTDFYGRAAAPLIRTILSGGHLFSPPTPMEEAGFFSYEWYLQSSDNVIRQIPYLVIDWFVYHRWLRWNDDALIVEGMEMFPTDFARAEIERLGL